MRRPLPLYLLAATALLACAFPALALPTPLPQGSTPFPTALPSALATPGAAGAAVTWFAGLSTALGAGAWVLGHWQQIGELIAIAIALYQAVRAHQWTQLVSTAGQLTFALATLSSFDNDAKRRTAERELYQKAGGLARALFSEEQFTLAVETGWKLIAKPKLDAKA